MEKEDDENYIKESVKYNKTRKVDLGFSSTAADTKQVQLRAAWAKPLLFYKMNSKLYQKYSSSQNYYYIKEVNDILSDARTQSVLVYKQMADVDVEGVHVRKFVDSNNYMRKMRGLVDYYRFHKEIPRIFAKNVYDLYFDHHDKKRKVEYVIITRGLKMAKGGEDPKKLLEEKLKKQRSKKFEPYLNALPEYTFIQQYYHRRPSDYPDESKTFFSIFDHLHRLVNSSKISNQSFMQAENSSSHNASNANFRIVTEDEKEIDKQQKIIEHAQKFNFTKKKSTFPTPNNPVQAKHAVKKRSLSPSPELLEFPFKKLTKGGVRELKLEVEEIKSLKRLTNVELPGKAMNSRHGAEGSVGGSKVRSRRAGSNPKELSENHEPLKLKNSRLTNYSLKVTRKPENDKKRLSRERKEFENGSSSNPPNHWRSVEKSLEAQAPEEKPNTCRGRSNSRKKKKQSVLNQADGLKKSINFNFNWTKVNKILTNPLLINKSLAQQTKALTHRDRGESKPDQPLPKNYLGQKSKILKGYHHKVNSMLLTHIQNDHMKEGSKFKNKAGDIADVFSRKNSYGEMDLKALFSSREKQKKPRFISHSKKNSIYNLSSAAGVAGKKKSGQPKLKKKKNPSTGVTYDSSQPVTRTFNQGSQVIEGSIVYAADHEVKKNRAGEDTAVHKHTKSEPEKLFHLNIHKKDSQISGSSVEERSRGIVYKIAQRLPQGEQDLFSMKKKSHNLLDVEGSKKITKFKLV